MNDRDLPPTAGKAGAEGATFAAAVAGVVAVAFLLRVHRIGAQEIWVDEAFSYFLATRNDWLKFALVDSTPPLYYALLRVWESLAGGSEASLRLLSACFGAAFAGATIWTGTAILDRRAALWAGVIAAIAPMHVYYSQEARSYALLVLLLQILLGLVWRALDGDSWKRWAAVAACSTLVLYTHYFGVFVLAAALVLPVLRRDRRGGLRQAGAFALAFLVLAPWVVFNLRTKYAVIGGGSPIAWIAKVWSHTPPLLAIPKSLEVLGLGSQRGLLPLSLKQMSLLEFPAALRWLGLAVLAMLFSWAFVRSGDRNLPIPNLGRRKASLFAWLFLPLVAMWAASFVRPLYVVGRFDLVALPAYVLLLGLSLAKLWCAPRAGPRLAAFAFVLLSIPVAAKLERYYDHDPAGRRRATAAALHERVIAGDVVAFTGLRGLATLYYLERLGVRWEDGWCHTGDGMRFGCRLYPRSTEDVLAASTLDGTPPPETVRADVDDYLARLESPRARLWLVLDEPSEADSLLLNELHRRGFVERDADRALKIVRLER